MKKLLLFLLSVAACVQPLSAQIKKNSKLQISVMGVPVGEQARINSTYPVDANGNIRMWEIGTIRAAGLTSTNLAKKIEQAYKNAEIYTTPAIIIQEIGNVDQELVMQVTVSGSVHSAGTYPLLQRNDLGAGHCCSWRTYCLRNHQTSIRLS